MSVQATTVLTRGRPTNYIDTTARVIKVHSVLLLLMLTVPQQRLMPRFGGGGAYAVPHGTQNRTKDHLIKDGSSL